MIQSHIGSNVPLIIEPERRDTFPAIALAAAYFYSEVRVDVDEVITVMPVDPYVDEEFFDKLKELEDVVRQSGASIALMGANPTYPAEKYGYIVPFQESGKRKQNFSRVHYFKEKPSAEQAERLITQHALWNCGVFSFKLGYLIRYLEERDLPLDYAAMKEQYDKLPSISFDYEIVEKAEEIVVIPYNGYWSDLGTWNSLTEDLHTKLIGKGLISEDSINSHLINELDIPVAILGVSDVVVAASSDGILVSDKLASHQIKDFVKHVEQRPMFEERRWGWYRVLDYHTSAASGMEFLTKRICVLAGKNLSYQFHHQRSEVWTIVAGEGEFVLDGRLFFVQAGDVLKIPVGAKHAIKALSDLHIIEVQMGSKLVEEDIVRLYMSWEEMKQSCAPEE